jgi:hypothetical protein
VNSGDSSSGGKRLRQLHRKTSQSIRTFQFFQQVKNYMWYFSIPKIILSGDTSYVDGEKNQYNNTFQWQAAIPDKKKNVSIKHCYFK